MSTTENLARFWLSPAKGSFWEWSDDGEVVCWADGSTLIFRRELASIISELASDGLPPASALFLLLGACRPNWRGRPARFGELKNLMLAATMDHRLRWLQLLSDDLDAVSKRAVKQMPTSHKAALARAVFEDTQDCSTPEVAREVLLLLEGTSTELFDVRSEETESGSGDFWPDLRWVRYGLESFSISRLDDYISTGLDRLPQPADDVASPEFQSVRELLASLDNDEELAGLVRLTKRMMAAISLPRAISDPDELPIGGVSDIANRGEFDKLLLSELASDDDVLMTRVALNEALYLRRESPPRMPPESRLILIDSGIRMWGLPRLFAAATALALAANADSQTDVSVFTAGGSNVCRVPFRSRDDLVAHMERLTTEAHPGDALATLREHMEENDSSGVILVTSPDALADADFRRRLDEAAFPECHIAAVSRSGEFELSVRRAGGSKVITRLQLELESILEPPSPAKRARPLVRADLDPQLPALLSVKPFPFLLPHPLLPGKFWQVGKYGVLAISHDRRLTLWTNCEHGPELLFDRLPAGDLFWRYADPDVGLSQFVLRNNGRYQLVTVDVGERIVSVTELTDPIGRLKGMCSWGHKLFLIGRSQIATLDRQTGDVDSVLNVPAHMRWIRDRFFRVGAGMKVLGLNGTSAAFQDLDPVLSRVHAISAFDCPSEGGPVFMNSDGTLVRSDGQVLLNGNQIPLTPPFEIVDTYDYGTIVSLREIPTGRCAVVCVRERKASLEIFRYHVAAAPGIGGFVADQPLMTRIRGITLDGRYLGLQTHARCFWMNTARNVRGLTVRQLDNTQPLTGGPFGPLKRVAAPSGVLWRLRMAESADGSRVWVDSRGLIHLQSSDVSLPEISFAITAEEAVAAWTSDGLCVGSRSLIHNTAADENEAFERFRFLLHEFAQRVRNTA